jgi:hypothetical protein
MPCDWTRIAEELLAFERTERLNAEMRGPVLDEWIDLYGGYWAIPGARWDTAVASHRARMIARANSTTRPTTRSGARTAMNDAPQIRSVAEPPERHAGRIVGEMIKFLIAERQRRFPIIAEIMRNAPDASPWHQGRMVERLRAACGPGCQVSLKPGKRRRYVITVYDWTAWDPAIDQPIEKPGQAIPADSWLAVWFLRIEARGRYRRKTLAHPLLLLKPHALSRRAQRCGLRTVFALMGATWNAVGKLIEEKGAAAFDEAPPEGWRLLFSDDNADLGTEVLRRHPRFERTLVLMTVWDGVPDTQSETQQEGAQS